MSASAGISSLARPYASAVSIKLTPSSTARRTTRTARPDLRLTPYAVAGETHRAETDSVDKPLFGDIERQSKRRSPQFVCPHQGRETACRSRNSAIHRAPHWSRPNRRSPARTASTQAVERASMIALVIPWLWAIDRKAAPSNSRPRQSKRCVRHAARHIHLEFVTDQTRGLEEEHHGARLLVHGGCVGIDNDILGRGLHGQPRRRGSSWPLRVAMQAQWSSPRHWQGRSRLHHGGRRLAERLPVIRPAR